ncbi:chloroplastic lipocalin isoform X2 [Wolffia australiana]
MAVLQVLGQLGSTPPAFLRKVPPTSCKLVCSLEKSSISKDVSKHLLAGLSASLVLLSPMNKVIAAEQPQYNNICHLAILSDSNLALKLDNETGDVPGMLMMRSMTVQNFDPVRYSGRWFEVASLKRGFAGQGQEDCHCTQGVYTFNPKDAAIMVDTFCAHGAPDGYITGIRGKVQCLADEEMVKTDTDLGGEAMIMTTMQLFLGPRIRALFRSTQELRTQAMIS